MDNAQNNNGTNANNSNAPEVTHANHGQTGLAGLLFGNEGDQGKDKGPEESAETQPGITEGGYLSDPDDGAEVEGAIEPGEGADEVTEEATDTWEYDGREYTNDQIAEAIKGHETYQRFNESIQPLVEGIRQYSQTAQDLKIAATTECEKAIAELQNKLNSGQLDSREYQATHMQLMQAKDRMRIIDGAVQQEKQQREAALNQARQQKARQVVTNLMSSGWSREEIATADALAQTAFTPETYADALSPELMAVLRDAAKHRQSQKVVEERLRAAGKKAVQVKAAKAPTKVVKAEKKGLASLIWGN
ncbi:Uncharacterised protein [Serratia quinivorans]|uniref:hypothetical protein n=1 Tax=Serratia quinivorans TaxID=137545 RepID=UPI002177BA92|nr:hypothetical protein [Serratia quinivorans]CAI1768673.1 Uncharacterised protein [Serratia quinivorans]